MNIHFVLSLGQSDLVKILILKKDLFIMSAKSCLKILFTALRNLVAICQALVFFRLLITFDFLFVADFLRAYLAL